jgi:hypothetical protein
VKKIKVLHHVFIFSPFVVKRYHIPSQSSLFFCVFSPSFSSLYVSKNNLLPALVVELEGTQIWRKNVIIQINTFYLTMGAGIAHWFSAGLQAGWSRVWVAAGTGNFSLHHHVQTGSGAHTASYLIGTRGSFPGGKVVGLWSWQLPSII